MLPFQPWFMPLWQPLQILPYVLSLLRMPRQSVMQGRQTLPTGPERAGAREITIFQVIARSLLHSYRGV